MSNVGGADGLGSAARFNSPSAVLADSNGNLYVADAGNNTIRKISASGAVTTFAGSAGVTGHADGNGAAASFNAPLGLGIDSLGNVYVADTGNRLIRKITPEGAVTTLYAGGSFVSVAVDAGGNVFAMDGNDCLLTKITPSGVATEVPGPNSEAWCQLAPTDPILTIPPTPPTYQDAGLANDNAGNIYVAASGAIDKIAPDGAISNVLNVAGLRSPAIAVDKLGNMFVLPQSAYNNGETAFTIEMITPAGIVSTLAGANGNVGSTDGKGAAAEFNNPRGIAVDTAGNVIVADFGNDTIRNITSAGVVSTLAGVAPAPGSADGVGAAASFNAPQGMASDSSGNLYVADSGNNTIRVISPSGAVKTLAGSTGVTGNADGSGGAASFNLPMGVAVDGAGNAYVSDTRNCTIRKITPAGATTTLAGQAGMCGNADGTGAIARFNNPQGMAIDCSGNILVADTGNNAIRKVTATGDVTTLTATTTSLVLPYDVTTDASCNVYAASTYSNTIGKVAANGSVATLAGNAGLAGRADGTGAAASFDFPMGVAADSAGNLYVADTGNNVIRKVTPAGVVSTVVGTQELGFIAGPLPGGLVAPVGIAIHDRSLYIATGNGIAVVNNLP